MLAFEDNCFCFQVTSLLKVNSYQKMFIKGTLFLIKIPVTGKTKSSILQKLAVVFFDIINIMLMLLAKCEFDGWFIYFKNKE